MGFLYQCGVDTSFKLISDFFHVNPSMLIKVFCVVSMLSKLGGGGGGGGGQQACQIKEGGATGFLV